MGQVALVLRGSKKSTKRLRKIWLTYLRVFDNLTEDEIEALAKSNAKAKTEPVTE